MALYSCSKCGGLVSDTAAKCPACGNPIAEDTPQSSKCSDEKIKCPECGTLVTPRSGICPECGYPIDKYAESTDSQQSVEMSDIEVDYSEFEDGAPKYKNQLGIFVLIAIVIVVAVFLMNYFMSPKDSELAQQVQPQNQQDYNALVASEDSVNALQYYDEEEKLIQ